MTREQLANLNVVTVKARTYKELRTPLVNTSYEQAPSDCDIEEYHEFRPRVIKTKASDGSLVVKSDDHPALWHQNSSDVSGDVSDALKELLSCSPPPVQGSQPDIISA